MSKESHAKYMRDWRRKNQDSHNASQAKLGRAGIGLMKCHCCKLEYQKERYLEGRYLHGKFWMCPECLGEGI